MESADYCDNAINICPTADCLSDRLQLPTVAGKRRREDFARKNKNVGVQRDPSESEVWSVGWEGKEGRGEDKKSSLLFHDGFSVGIRNPGMKGESEWIVDCLR